MLPGKRESLKTKKQEEIALGGRHWNNRVPGEKVHFRSKENHSFTRHMKENLRDAVVAKSGDPTEGHHRSSFAVVLIFSVDR